jgi:hypothetical protein
MKRRAAADANKIFAAACFAAEEDAKAEVAATTGVEIFAISFAAVAEGARCLVDDADDKPPFVVDKDAVLVALTDENDDDKGNVEDDTDDNDDLTAAPVATPALGVCQKSAAA